MSCLIHFFVSGNSTEKYPTTPIHAIIITNQFYFIRCNICNAHTALFQAYFFFLISSWRGYISHLRIYRKGGRLCKHENKYNWFMVLKIRLLLYNFHHIELTYIYLFITLFYNSNLLNSSWKSPSLRYLQSTNCFVSGFDIAFDMFKTKLYQSLEKCETIENVPIDCVNMWTTLIDFW